MLFGRGGVGGLINRVSKEAGWNPLRQGTLQLGTNSNKRAAVDVGQPLNDSVAFRINGMYEDSDSYRDDVTLKRYGVNPTLTWRSGAGTKISFGVEYFHDERIADRGVSSFEGRPLSVDASTFFGDPAQSPTHATVKMANAHIEHRFSETLVLRNRTRYGDYDKFYQNVFAGEVDETGSSVALLAYNNATQR
jgi:catecholate siderophore receptor